MERESGLSDPQLGPPGMPAGRVAIAVGAQALRRAGLSAPRRGVGAGARLGEPWAAALPEEGAGEGAVRRLSAEPRSRARPPF